MTNQSQFEPYRPPQNQPPTAPYHQSPNQLPVPAPYPALQSYRLAPVAFHQYTDQQPISTATVIVSWVVTFFTAFYMLPWAIAASRGKANQWTTFAVNLLLGWTVIGWVVALVLACTAHQPVGYQLHSAGAMPALSPGSAPPGWYPNPDGGRGQRYWNGSAWTEHRD